MHILIIPSGYPSTYNNLSGIFFKEQAEALAKYNHKVGLIATQGIHIKDIIRQRKVDFSKKVYIENGVNTYRLQYPSIPKISSIRKKIKSILFTILFKEYIKNHGLPDIVHLHLFVDGELAMWIKEKYNIPYVVTEHYSGFSRDIISDNDLLFARKIFKNSSFNIAVSHEFVRLINTKFKQDFKYIPNIVNVNYFSLKKNNNTEYFEFINIGFLKKNKNQEMLIKSFTKIFRNLTEVRLTIVGDGSEYENLNKLIKSLNMQSQIVLHGRANRFEVKELLQNADAFVLSSEYETFGVVIIEAMACGLPVISTKSGGPESIITSKKIGLLSNNKELDLAEALNTLYQNRENYDAKYIRQYTKNNFSEKVVCNKLTSIYEKVLSKHYTQRKVK